MMRTAGWIVQLIVSTLLARADVLPSAIPVGSVYAGNVAGVLAVAGEHTVVHLAVLAVVHTMVAWGRWWMATVHHTDVGAMVLVAGAVVVEIVVVAGAVVEEIVVVVGAVVVVVGPIVVVVGPIVVVVGVVLVVVVG